LAYRKILKFANKDKIR